MNDYFLIAKIASPYGDAGFFKISSYSDFPERFEQLKKVYIDFFGKKKEFFVEDVKQVKNSFIIKLKNFDSADDIEVLLGKEVFVHGDEVIALPENTFYIHSLIGSKVYQNEKLIGEIKDVLTLPANDVYVIENESGNELLIPAVLAFVESFDEEKKELRIKPDANLEEDNDEN